MDKVQEHIEKVREALQDTEKSATHADYQNAVRNISMMANLWLQQSLDIIEQQQREIERLKSGIKEAMDEEWKLAGEPTPVYMILQFTMFEEVSTDVQDEI